MCICLCSHFREVTGARGTRRVSHLVLGVHTVLPSCTVFPSCSVFPLCSVFPSCTQIFGWFGICRWNGWRRCRPKCDPIPAFYIYMCEQWQCSAESHVWFISSPYKYLCSIYSQTVFSPLSIWYREPTASWLPCVTAMQQMKNCKVCWQLCDASEPPTVYGVTVTKSAGIQGADMIINGVDKAAEVSFVDTRWKSSVFVGHWDLNSAVEHGCYTIMNMNHRMSLWPRTGTFHD